MNNKVDVKTLVVGLLVGFLLALAMGAYGTGGADFAVAVPSGGFAIVRTSDGSAFIITQKGQVSQLREPISSGIGFKIR